MSDWIKVEAEKPPVNEDVLIARWDELTREFDVDVGFVDPDGQWAFTGEDWKLKLAPKYWMPLPDPPEE